MKNTTGVTAAAAIAILDVVVATVIVVKPVIVVGIVDDVDVDVVNMIPSHVARQSRVASQSAG